MHQVSVLDIARVNANVLSIPASGREDVQTLHAKKGVDNRLQRPYYVSYPTNL
jgi:hypothetical protein